ncbi:TY-Chap domain-containing protein [Pseudarthrobacter sp. C1]|uniref:TY-Chap domain-containing protein n=1 Tax=Pseudarthrobacter sp. C1 TaxID=3108940 RepID=UPI002B0564BC|nr:hypothetical protein [Pseudarthrobacter sp. C1]MEA3549248.1 hypothetical protein [Pseudarthrobacter sp. C1]
MTEPDSNTSINAERGNPTDQAVASYVAGDPLRCIAASLQMDSYQVLRLLSTRIADNGEKQRSKALRNRCSITAEVLGGEMERTERLLSAGIESVDVPKVLVAFGVPLDVEIAVELLRSLEIFEDIYLRVSHVRSDHVPVVRSIEMLSLLYIIGRHRGVEPDYRFALGKMPLPGIAEFRELQTGRLPASEIAEVIATVEKTAEAIRTGNAAGISYSEFRDTTSLLAEETDYGGLGWLVPARVIRDRVGRGSWSVTLEAAGLAAPSQQERFERINYEEAAQDFLNMYRYFGSPKDVASYDSWVIAEAAAGRDRPSVIAIRRHFGAWESVIGAAMPPEVGVDEFAGLVAMCRTQNDVEYDWARAGELVSEVLANMPWNSFLSIDYGDETDGPKRPYAQANPSADGVWCEIVSEEFLSANQWPIDTDYLIRNGWSAPDEEVPNWHKQGIAPLEAGHQLMEGLTYGRDCRDPQKVRWHSAEFPGGPGPGGGLILDFAASGVNRDVRRAS